jgi:superfamily II DNA or RNA helicase
LSELASERLSIDVKVILENSQTTLHGADKAVTDALNRMMSYKVNGHHFAPSFRAGYWDGRVKLLRRAGKGGLRFPTGLLFDALKVISNLGRDEPEIEDKRRKFSRAVKLEWKADDIILRDYQLEAVKAATSSSGLLPGRGILKLPIRSGKTVVAAALIHHWQRRAVFVATSQLILTQTVALFRRIFGDCVGVIGEGEFDPNVITVALIQSLQKMKPKVKKLLARTDVLIVDEVHHMKGDTWREPIMRANARVKLGLSATVKVSRKACERSAVWLKSATGPILIDVPMKRLVDGGFILPLDILIAEFDGKGYKASKASYPDACDKLIVNCDERNQTIVGAAKILAEAGHKVLIDVGLLAHIKKLYSLALSMGVEASIIYGGTTTSKRVSVLDDFVNGRKSVLIGTILGEGVDVPVLSAVINAEGGKAYDSTIQRMRNLTQHPDKDQALLIDFNDSGNRYLKQHSKARLKHYKAEPIFNVTESIPAPDFLRTLQAAIDR